MNEQTQEKTDFKLNVKLNYQEAPDEMINSAVQKFNFVEAAIAELAEKYMSLKVSGPDDKQNYKLCHIANMDIKKKISAVGDLGKALRADAIKEQKTIIAVEKTIINLLEPIQIHLESQKAVVDDEKKRIEAEREQAILDRYRDRAAKLAAVGMIFNGVAYNFLNHTIQAESLKTMEDDFFNAFLRVVESDFKSEEARKTQERERQELLNKQLKEQKEKMDELEKQNADFKKQQADLVKQKKEMREERLFNMGFSWDGKKYVWNKGVLVVTAEEINLPDVDFARLVDAVWEKVKEAKALLVRSEDRISDVITIGLVSSGSGFKYESVSVGMDQIMTIGEPDWENFISEKRNEFLAAKSAKEKADADARALAEKEAKEKATALMGDRERISKFMQDITAVEVPELKAAVSKRVLKVATSKINEALAELKREIKNLS